MASGKSRSRRAGRASSAGPQQQALARGLALQRQGRLRDAEYSYREILEQQPQHAAAHHALGLLYFQAGRLSLSVEYLRRGLSIRPKSAPAWNDLGNTLRDLGELDEAADAFARAVRLDADFALAHCSLAQLRDHREPDAHDKEWLAMRQAYARSRAGSPERRDLAWGMACALEQRGEIDGAFACLQEAHRIQASAGRFDIAATAKYLASIREALNADCLAERGQQGRPTELPVFVVGLPRSGTSLVEQILASHSAVHGAGELRWVGQLCADLEQRSGRSFAAAFASLGGGAVADIAADFEGRLRRLAPTAARVVDKMPANFIAVGMLATLFPSARFVHCRRDPMATCWSIYSTRFAEAQPFADTLEDLGAYYRLYEEHMAWWAELLPDRLVEVDYEGLIDNPEANIKSLLNSLDLAWEPACLDFHRTPRAVRTASAQQVRQPLFRDSLRRWEPFAEQLEPLRRALGEQR